MPPAGARARVQQSHTKACPGGAGEVGQKEGCEQHVWLMGRRGEDLSDENLGASWTGAVWGTCQHIVRRGWLG